MFINLNKVIRRQARRIPSVFYNYLWYYYNSPNSLSLLTIPATPFSVLTSSYRSSLSYSSPSVLQPYRLIRYLGISFLSAVPTCESGTVVWSSGEPDSGKRRKKLFGKTDRSGRPVRFSACVRAGAFIPRESVGLFPAPH